MTRRGSLLLGVLAGTLFMSACDHSSEPASSPAPTPTQRQATAPSAIAPTAQQEVEPKQVTIAFAGDIHFEGVLRDRLDDPATALAPVTGTLAAADVAVVNLETSVGTGGRASPASGSRSRHPRLR